MPLKLTREQIENSDELNIATGCIVSDVFLSEVFTLLKQNSNLIKAPGVKKIIHWCIEYYTKHHEAPKALIQDIFISQQRSMDQDSIESVGTILSNLNERYLDAQETFNEGYYVNKTKDYIKEKSLLNLAQEIQGAISLGKVDEAEKLLSRYNKVDKVLSMGIDPFTDSSIVEKMFDALAEGILHFPLPELFELFQRVYRKDVISVAGKAKAGKSFMMQQFALWGMDSGLNVAMFSFEMGVEIMSMRLFQNIMGQTRNKTEEPFKVPYFEGSKLMFKEITKEGLNREEVEQSRKYYSMEYGGKLRFFDSDSCGRRVSDIVSSLNRLEQYENWKADMVVIDYDMLLENESSFSGSTYDGVNAIWKDVKNKIANDLNCVVVFGSQINKQGAKGDNSPLNASHSSRKFDWVSLWVSLIASESERRNSVARLRCLGRHHDFTKGDLIVTQALGLARPVIEAKFKEDISNYDSVISATAEDIEEEQDLEEEKKEVKKSWTV